MSMSRNPCTWSKSCRWCTSQPTSDMTQSSTRQVNTLIISLLHCLLKNVNMKKAERNKRNCVCNSPNASNLSSCLLHICGGLWVVCRRMGCVFLYFLWVYICVHVYAHVLVHTTQSVYLVEGFICRWASLPVAVVTMAWPSALSW